MGPLVAAVDIGGTKTALWLVELPSGRKLGARRVATPTEQGPDAFLGFLEGLISELTGRQPARGDLRAIGVSVPGAVDAQGRVLRAGKLSGWEQVPLAGLLRERLGAVPFVEQDANAAALGERWLGHARGMSDFVFLAMGTGLGAGLFLGGRLYRGHHHFAGEVGNLVPARELLGAGPPGQHNLGRFLGGRTIREEAQARVGEWLSAAQSLRVAESDSRLEGLLDAVADHAALAVIDIAALLDPEAIIFGGGTASAGEALLRRVRERVEGELPLTPRLLVSSLGEEAQLQGALYGALVAARDEGAGLGARP